MFKANILLLLILLCSCQHKVLVTKNIELQNASCNDLNKELCNCDCVKWIIDGDEKHYLINNYKDYGHDRDSFAYCFRLKLFLETQTVSLDSLYLASIQNKGILYIPGFVDGDTKEDNREIEISLRFINDGINTSHSTLHQFTILYSKRSKKIIKTKLSFLKDESAVPH